MKLHGISLGIRGKIGNMVSTSPALRWLSGMDRLQIFNPAITRGIINHYDGGIGHQAIYRTGNLGFGFIHYALILNLKPARVLCVGSRKGYIPAICALACAENGRGRVDFVDAGYGEGDTNHWSGIGWWKRTDPDRHFSRFGANTRLSTYVMTTGEFAKRFHYTYDYIYIDGDHSYEGASADWNLFWPRLRENGIMAYHDVSVRHTRTLGDFGVWKLWKEKVGAGGILFPFPKSSGLGMVQKRREENERKHKLRQERTSSRKPSRR